MKQVHTGHKSFTPKYYRTSQTVVRLLIVSISVLAFAFVSLTLFHILAAMLFTIPFLGYLLAVYSAAIIDVFCGEDHLEIRRLKVFPPTRIVWSDIRDVKWDKRERILIYLHSDPHPVHIETVPYAKLDGDGLLQTIRERAGLLEST